VGTDQFGRPVYGEMRQQGGILYAQSGSNRRFDDFDQVIAIDPDGTSTHRGGHRRLEHRAGERLEAFASYTFSRHRGQLEPHRLLRRRHRSEPTPGGAGDWMDGTCRTSTCRIAPSPASRGRERRHSRGCAPPFSTASNRGPFTPGFRAGVDANADGSSRNDPAFIDADVPGMEPLLGAWSCLSEQTGASRGAIPAAARRSTRGCTPFTFGFARSGGFPRRSSWTP
jgi:hypothetical protein